MIDKIRYCDLSWSNSEEIQKRAIDFFSILPNLDVEKFILPFDKDLFENCAIILSNRKNEELYPYIDKLLEWCQDVHWPGHMIIVNKICSMDLVHFEKPLTECIEKIIELKDDVWALGVYFLMREIKVEYKLDEDIMFKLNELLDL